MWLAFAIILSLLARVARAECNPASAPNSRWKVVSSGEAWWLATPCGERFFSAGINGLDPEQLDPPAHRARTRETWAPVRPALGGWAKKTLTRIRGWGFNTAGGFSAPNLPIPNVPELDLGWRANILWSDPFDPSAQQRVIEITRKAVDGWKGNPYRIGYFPTMKSDGGTGRCSFITSASPPRIIRSKNWLR